VPRDFADAFQDGVAWSDLRVQPTGPPRRVPAVTSHWATTPPEMTDSLPPKLPRSRALGKLERIHPVFAFLVAVCFADPIASRRTEASAQVRLRPDNSVTSG